MRSRRAGNKKMFLALVMVFSLFITGRSLGQSQEAGVKIPEEVLMTVPKGTKNRKFPVPFLHAKHQAFDCTVCHHNAYETLLMCSCSIKGCHSDTKERKGTESFYAAFHSESPELDRSCLDCHKTGKKGPTGCPDCHQQK